MTLQVFGRYSSFVCDLIWKWCLFHCARAKAVTSDLSTQSLFSAPSAASQILLHKLIRNSRHRNGLFCILHTSIWLYWVMLRSGNAIQIWANEFCFKDWAWDDQWEGPSPAGTHTCRSAGGRWAPWLSGEVKFIFSRLSRTQLILNKASERISQQTQWCWNLSGTAILKPVLWHPTGPSNMQGVFQDSLKNSQNLLNCLLPKMV